MNLYDEGLKKELKEIVKEKSVFKGKFLLSSGKESNYYIDIRNTSLDAKGVVLCAKLFLPLLKDVEGVGGPTLGADPFIGAVLYEAHTKGKELYGFIVRKDPKRHGTRKMIEGPIKEGSTVAIIEDVITSGSSVANAVKCCQEAGLSVKKILTVVDREEGGVEFLSKLGVPVYPIFRKSELLA